MIESFFKKPGTVVFDYKVKSMNKPLTLDNSSVDKEYKVLKKEIPSIVTRIDINGRSLQLY